VRRPWLLSLPLAFALSGPVAQAQAADGSATVATPSASGPDANLGESWLVPSLHSLGLMTVMRGTETYLWPKPFAETSRFGHHYREAFTRPPLWDSSRAFFEADGDRWQLNVLGHGLFGSELYLRARVCRKPLWQALLFTTGASTLWEYGFEANGVRPSALDLVYTPAAGLLLGEGRFQVWRAARRLEPGTARAVLQVVVDPLGELERSLGSPC
jgi:hypothetical protein